MENKASHYPTLLDRAIEFAVQQHAGQYRHDNITPYIFHPMEVVRGLMKKGIDDQVLLSAAVCHDVIEDTGCSYEGLASELGTEVADIVMKVTKVGIDESTIQNKLAFIKGIKDKSTDALLLKIQDRLCNVQDYLDGDRREWYAGYYALQAYPFYHELRNRKSEIVEVYGHGTYKAFLDGLVGLSGMVSRQYKLFNGFCENENILDELILTRNKGIYGKSAQ